MLFKLANYERAGAHIMEVILEHYQKNVQKIICIIYILIDLQSSSNEIINYIEQNFSEFSEFLREYLIDRIVISEDISLKLANFLSTHYFEISLKNRKILMKKLASFNDASAIIANLLINNFQVFPPCYRNILFKNLAKKDNSVEEIIDFIDFQKERFSSRFLYSMRKIIIKTLLNSKKNNTGLILFNFFENNFEDLSIISRNDLLMIFSKLKQSDLTFASNELEDIYIRFLIFFKNNFLNIEDEMRYLIFFNLSNNDNNRVDIAKFFSENYNELKDNNKRNAVLKKFAEFPDCTDLILGILDKYKNIIDISIKEEVKNIFYKLKGSNKNPQIMTYLIEEHLLQIKDLISSGEGDNLEFKSRLRWDSRKNCSNKELEYRVVKTISGFLNTVGGTLLIGIGDDGKIVGLEDDYNSLGKKNRDGFQLHLVEIITCHITEAFNDFWKIKFDNIDGKDICIVEVKRSPKPVYIDDKFYIRKTSSTRSLKIDEAHKYINYHFIE